jgi:hypothetical protein
MDQIKEERAGKMHWWNKEYHGQIPPARRFVIGMVYDNKDPKDVNRRPVKRTT